MNSNIIRILAGSMLEKATAYDNYVAVYLREAKDWANKTEGPVNSGEFSAKYYAQQAAQIHDSIEQMLSAVTEIYNNILTNYSSDENDTEPQEEGTE